MENNIPVESATNMPASPSEADVADAPASETDAAATATAPAEAPPAPTEPEPTQPSSPPSETLLPPEPEPIVEPEVQPTPPPSPPSPTQSIKRSKPNSSRRRKVYDIISMPAEKSMDDFIKMVNDRLSSKKYVPIGGVTFDEHKNLYIQAISLVQPEIKNKKSTRRFKK